MLVSLLFRSLKALSDKRWVAEDVAAFVRREDLFPIQSQRVGGMDVRGFLQRQPGIPAAKRIRKPHVHLVIHQPQRHLRNAHGPFADLDAVELMHVHPRQIAHVEFLFLILVERQQHFGLQRAEFAVGDDKEVAATARGVEKGQLTEAVVKVLQAFGASGGAVSLTGIEFGAGNAF